MPGPGRPFKPGCKPGPGRPKKSDRLKGYADAVRQACPPEVLGRIVRRLAKRALTQTGAEALRCAELVLKCTLGADPAALLALADETEELRALFEEQQRERQEQARRQTAGAWEPRSLAGESDGNGQGDQGGSDGNGLGDQADYGGGQADHGSAAEDWFPGRLF